MSIDSSPPLLTHNQALLLDFDGTLVELAEHPDAVQVPMPLPAMLREFSQVLQGAVAIISGRTLSSLAEQVRDPHLPLVGEHGAQFRQSGGIVEHPAPAAWPARVSQQLQDLLAADPRLLLELKSSGVSLHYRNAPERGAECRQRAESLAQQEGVQALHGHCVVELRDPQHNKGAAVARLATQAPFAGRLPVYVGDDRTDEDAFLSAQRLGGYGVKVGTGETAARYRLPSVTAVHLWMRHSLAILTDRADSP